MIPIGELIFPIHEKIDTSGFNSKISKERETWLQEAILSANHFSFLSKANPMNMIHG